MMNQQHQEDEHEEQLIDEPPPSSEEEQEEDPCNSSATTKVFQIDLILNQIIDYVPTNQLLSSRLVDRNWNSVILTKLNSSSCTKQHNSTRGGGGGGSWIIPITSKNIQDYIEFIKSTIAIATATATDPDKPSLSTCTATLTLPVPVLKPTFPLSVTIHKHYDNDSTYATIINGLHELISLFKPNNSFVSSFSISSGQNSPSPRFKRAIDWTQIFELISHLSSGLETLTIDEDPWKKSIQPINLPESISSFPKLSSLKYTAIVKNPYLLAQIVNAAPNLATLTLYIHPDQLQFTSGYTLCDQMVSDAYFEINSSSCSQLKELTLILFGDSSFSSISHLTFPKLQKLTLGLRENLSSLANRILSRFLTVGCPALSSLHFEYMYNPRGWLPNFVDGPEQSEFPAGLPPLPKLTRFGWSDVHNFAGNKYPNFIRLDHLLDPMSMFPSLHSVTIELGTYLYWSGAFTEFNFLQEDGPPTQPTWYNNASLIRALSFDSVSTLNLILRKNINFDGQPGFGLPKISLTDAANQYKLLFPFVTKLKIDVQILPKDRELAQLKNVLKAILLQLLDQLESLEITNYIQDWLCEFLMDDETLEFGNKLQNLRTLIIPSIERHLTEIIASRGACIGQEWKEFTEEGIGAQVRFNGVVVPVPGFPMTNNDDNDDGHGNEHGNNGNGNNDDDYDAIFGLDDIMANAAHNKNIPQIVGVGGFDINEELAAMILLGNHDNNDDGENNEHQEEDEAAEMPNTNKIALALQATIQNVVKSGGLQRIIESIQPSLNLNSLLPYLPSIQLIRLGQEFLHDDGGLVIHGDVDDEHDNGPRLGSCGPSNPDELELESGNGGESRIGNNNDIIRDIINNFELQYPQVQIQLI